MADYYCPQCKERLSNMYGSGHSCQPSPRRRVQGGNSNPNGFLINGKSHPANSVRTEIAMLTYIEELEIKLKAFTNGND